MAEEGTLTSVGFISEPPSTTADARKKNFFLNKEWLLCMAYNICWNLTDKQKENLKIQITSEPEIKERFFTFFQTLVILSNPASVSAEQQKDT